MKNDERMMDLEMRLIHQEAALEELTKASLEQDKVIRSLRAELKQLNSMVRQLSPAAAGSTVDEPPPPHY